MAKSENILGRFTQIWDSPQVVAEIDRALEQNQRDREDLLDLRKMAARRHGEPTNGPSEPNEDAKPEAKDADTLLNTDSLTLNSLAERYKTDPDSNFQSLEHASRTHYENLLRLILRDYGEERLSNINARVILQWHANWSEGNNGSTAHAKIGMLRRLMGFGATMLEDADCTRLSLVLTKLKFEVPKGRTEKMTSAQADAIRAMAHQKERPSIALAQAFQFDVRLRQKDVIGDWIPVRDRGESNIIDGHDNKWVRGLRWEEIDDNLILRKQATYGDIAFDLHLAPKVMEELHSQFAFDPQLHDRAKLPSKGPIIISEHDKLPWAAIEFRRWWRQVADAAGLPPEIRNADSRKKDD